MLIQWLSSSFTCLDMILKSRPTRSHLNSPTRECEAYLNVRFESSNVNWEQHVHLKFPNLSVPTF